MPPRIRVICIGLFTHGDRFLVGEGHDAVAGTTFYRPIGGEIEFGESAAEALAREVREELGREVADLRTLGVIENRFTYEGDAGHEIVFVLDGRFVDASVYSADRVDGVEDGSIAFRSWWKRLDDFGEDDHRLVPGGLSEHLVAWGVFDRSDRARR